MPSLLWVNQFALLPGDGGGTRHFELGRELAGRGWQVTILASDLHLHSRHYTRREYAADRAAKVQTQDGVEMRWLWAARYERNNWQRAWNWWTFHRSVLREVDALAQRPDVVIGSSPQLFAATAARRFARRLGVPFVFEVRDLWPESLLAAGGRRGPGYYALGHVANGLYRDADRILVLARGAGDYLIERGVPAAKIGYVPNGVDVHALAPATQARTTNGAPFTFVYAGAHGPANGLDCVLEAAARLGPEANLRFILIGDGPAKPALVRRARELGLGNVEFRDPVSKLELASVLHEADAGLMILREAPLFAFGVSPNKLFDYLAAGLPVVCNVPGDTARMLREAEAGEQATDSRPAALAAAMYAMAARPPDVRRQMARRGRAWVTREHSREVLGAQLDSQLRALLGS